MKKKMIISLVSSLCLISAFAISVSATLYNNAAWSGSRQLRISTTSVPLEVYDSNSQIVLFSNEIKKLSGGNGYMSAYIPSITGTNQTTQFHVTRNGNLSGTLFYAKEDAGSTVYSYIPSLNPLIYNTAQNYGCYATGSSTSNSAHTYLHSSSTIDSHLCFGITAP